MRTALDHLPPKKQTQLRALVDLIREHVEVEMVILFGSYARGDWVEDAAGGYFSDFDVLVVVEKASTVARHKLWSKIETRAQRITKPTVLSLIVHDLKDVNEQLEKGHYFFSDLKREGIVLYDSKRHRLGAAKKMTPEDRLDYAKTNFDEWFGSAQRFYGTFEYDLSKGWTKEAAFLLHQTTERLYHTVLLVLTAYKPKTHNLEDLGKRASDLSPELRGVFPRNTPDEDRLFKLLKSAYIDARYKLTYSITTEELEMIATWVKDLSVRVERVCKERIATLSVALQKRE